MFYVFFCLFFFNVVVILYVIKFGKNKIRYILIIKIYLLEVLNINNG